MDKTKLPEYPPFNLDIPRMGYVLAYKSDGKFFSRMIVAKQLRKGFTKEQAQVVHIEISGGGADSILAAPPRSRRVKITKEHAGRYLYILRYKNEDYEKRGRYKVAYFSATLNNTGYDVLGILGFVFNWIKQSNRLFFCSEGALWSFRKQYSEVLKCIEPHKCMPAQFLSCKTLEVVWQGQIPKEVS